MTSKSCLNCTYLCHVRNGDIVSWTKDTRDGKTEYPGLNSKCFCDEWTRKQNSDLVRDIRYMADFSVSEKGITVEGANGRPICISSYCCKLHHPFDANSSKPLETIRQEEQQRKNNIRYWITTAIAIIAIIIFLISLWKS